MSNPSSTSPSDVSFHAASAAPSIVFAVFFAITFLYYIVRVIKNPTHVFIVLSLFCAIRVATHGVATAVEGSNILTHQIIRLTIAFQILYDAGIFALLYSTHALVHDRRIMTGNIPKNIILRITSSIWLILFLLTAGTALGITAFTYFIVTGDLSAVVIQLTEGVVFLFVTILLAIHAAIQTYKERAMSGRDSHHEGGIEMYIPCLIVLFLLIRGIYRMVTEIVGEPTSIAAQYCLGTLPEFLAVLFFAVPGLVPERDDLFSYAFEHDKA